jgi:hypothetical protein
MVSVKARALLSEPENRQVENHPLSAPLGTMEMFFKMLGCLQTVDYGYSSYNPGVEQTPKVIFKGWLLEAGIELPIVCGTAAYSIVILT